MKPRTATLTTLLVLFWTVLSGASIFGQCPGEAVLDHSGAPCGYGLMKGQSIMVATDGTLSSVTLTVCSGANNRLVVRQFNGTGPDWDEGVIIGEADAVVPAIGAVSDCFVSIHGFTHYTEQTFTFSNVALAANTSYILHLIEGAAATGCSVGYGDGEAFNADGPLAGSDLVFTLTYCPTPGIVFGCTDPSACNFDPTATGEDGSCQALDCQGTCGGPAYLDPDCGCLDSEAEAGSCLGCTDPSSCNFDAAATVEDGSCLPTDCNGDCGGSATLTACGCIGGNTGTPGNACIDGCTTTVIATDSTSCSPGLMLGQDFVAAATGYLKQVRLKVCCAMDAQVTLREYVDPDPCIGGGGDWNSGAPLGVSNVVASSCSGLSQCLTAGGLDGYGWAEFDFADVPLELGRRYVLELNEGVAITACAADYPDGMAYDASGAVSNRDLVMEVLTCPDALVFGCTDPGACSGYDPGATHDDGSCLYLDCHGDCGGTAVIGDCGCVEGLTGIPAAQCVDGTLQSLLAHDAAVCSGTRNGQVFTMTEDGFLTRAGFTVGAASAQTVELSHEDGPLAGTLLGSASRSASTDPCATGTTLWYAFPWAEIPMEAGRQYRLTFTAGQGRLSCSDYAGGHALQDGTPTGDDLAFRIVHRAPTPGELIWGCTDPSYCNYDPAATHDNGSCDIVDCNGDCAGGAQDIPGCGCVGGLTGIDPQSCYGCMDPAACNYDDGASIDDGSCAQADCYGTCGGSAILDDHCGCIEGETGLSADDCTPVCQGDPTLTSYTADFPFVTMGVSGSGQTFTAAETTYLSGLRVRQWEMPSAPLTVEWRLLDAPDVHDGTLLATWTHHDWTDLPGYGGDALFESDTPIALTAGTGYAMVFMGTEWKALIADDDLVPGGAFSGLDASAGSDDVYFELLTCDSPSGCTSPQACNYDDWAGTDDGSCNHPASGFECDGTPCAVDADGDGVCASNDADDGNPYVCMDSDGDGCDDCSGGGFDPAQDGTDSDGDGLCDSGDLCSDTAADNYADPANLPCRGTCDSAPLFESITVLAAASGRYAGDGQFAATASTASMPFVAPSAYAGATVVCTGLNGTPDALFTHGTAPHHLEPGFYEVQVLDADGCPWVAGTTHGSTFGHAPVVERIIIRYDQCCTGCGDHDTDTDGICDSEDNCINRLAPNFADPANGSCLE